MASGMKDSIEFFCGQNNNLTVFDAYVEMCIRDRIGTIQMMELFYALNRKYNKTVLIVSHDMEQVYKYCDEVVVVEDGKIRFHDRCV